MYFGEWREFDTCFYISLLISYKRYVIILNYISESTTNDGSTVNLSVEARLLVVILLLTLIISYGLLITFYTEVTGASTATRNTRTGILLGTTSNNRWPTIYNKFERRIKIKFTYSFSHNTMLILIFNYIS